MGFDVVFAGGGVIGLSGAWEAGRAGLEVAVCDPYPGLGASWLAAGMLAPATEAHFGEEAHAAVMVAAAERWASFAGDLEASSGIEVGYRPCGTLVVGADPSDRAFIERLVAFQQSLGLGVEPRTASECRRLVPALAPAVAWGAEVHSDHQVDNRCLVQALQVAGAASGVTFIPSAVRSVRLDRGGAAVGVTLSDGTQVDAGQVVMAAGCESRRIEGVPESARPPVRPVKGHIVRLRGSPELPLLSRTVRAVVHGRSCYLVPRRDGTVVVGATMEERGFDRTVRAGPVHDLLADARTVVPGLDELELVECGAGLRPGSPDNGPIVGRTSVPGLVVATGHHRNGILLAPLTADALVELLHGREVTGPLAPFGAERFAEVVAPARGPAPG